MRSVRREVQQRGVRGILRQEDSNDGEVGGFDKRVS